MSVSPSLIPASINPNKYLPFNIPGLEFLIAFIIITFVGMISLTFIGKTLLGFGQRILNKIPILRTIYNGLGQLTKNFTSSNNKSKKLYFLNIQGKVSGQLALLPVITKVKYQIRWAVVNS